MMIWMKRTLSLWSIGILTLCGILAVASEQVTSPEIENIRLGAHKNGHTRIVLDMDAAPSFDVHPSSANDFTLYLLINQASYDVIEYDLPGNVGLVEAIGFRGGVLTITLEKPALPVRRFVLEPTKDTPHYRLVIDLEGVSTSAFSTAVAQVPPQAPPSSKMKTAETSVAKTQMENKPPADISDVVTAAAPDLADPASAGSVIPVPSLKPRASDTSSVRSSGGRLTIAIDPGHGGKDPGAIGSTGLQEKRVTWSVAQLLKAELSSRGYNVVLTRDGDTYVKLPKRIELAREYQADMFLSIHADANPVASVRGASVYTLSEARSEKMAKEAAAGGDFKLFDRELSGEDRDVSTILFDLANTDTKNQSEILAASLISKMQGRMKMVNNTHRHAGLVVLLSPDVPAVLVELAFMSNKHDEANLGSRTWRKNAAVSIADGVDAYFVNGRRAGVPTGASRGN